MINTIVLVGRLTRDPELKYTPGGHAVANFTLAVDRNFTNQDGEREADFIRTVVWRKLAETCAEYLHKGSLIAVTGRLQVRNYEDNDGNRRTIAEVVADNVRFLEPKKDRQAQQSGGQAPEDFFEGEVVDDDSVPF